MGNVKHKLSDHSQERGPFLKRVSVFGATGAIVVALMGLLGYVPGLQFFGSVLRDYIPMAPSTAVSFLVLGVILLGTNLRSLSRASLLLFGVMAAFVSLFGGLEVAGHFTGMDLNFEDTLVPAAGYLGEIPIARMSPSTGAVFLLGGLAVLVLVLRRNQAPGRGTLLGHLGGSLGCLVFGVSLVFCLAYLYGSPLLYGRGATIPMALTTAFAFLMLGAALVGFSGKDAIPLSLLDAMRADKSIIARKRFLFLVFIMAGVCAMVMVVIMITLYRHNIKEHREQLQATVKSQARLIEAIARHEKQTPEGPTEVTLSQIFDAHEYYLGFGETGEFTLARRDGNSIVFLLRSRHGAVEQPAPVALDSDLAEPMRRALQGISGTVIGLDYRGKTVLAAHEPVAVLNLGIVVKIDMSEIRAPFIRSGLAAATVALLVVLAGTAMFFWIGNPLITRLEAYSRDLEKEIKDRKRAEERTRAIADYTYDWESWVNPEGHPIWINPAVERITGYTVEECIAMETFPLPIIYEDDLDLMAKLFKEAVAGSAGNDQVFRIQHKDGSIRWAAVSWQPIFDNQGNSLGHRSSVRDITERKKAEVAEARLRLETERNQAQKLEAIGQLAGGIAHDFNNILTAIQGNAELLNLSVSSNSEDANFVNQIIRASQRAADLTKQLLGFARKGQFQIISVDAHKIINDVISLLSHSIDKRIEIKKDLKAAPSIVAGDPSQLENALLNLGLNARDAMPEGGSLIFSTRTTVLDDTFCQKHPYEITPGNYIQICVTDTGVGMSKDIQTRIFEPFFTTKPQGEGTGLGLAGVYGCVKSHNGSIQVYSEHGQGTTFTVYLPLCKEQPAPAKKTKQWVPIKGKGRILVVDDEKAVREFTGAALKNLGYSVTLCQDGIEAISYFKEHPDDIDLVILDLVMPKLSGEDTFRSLREINPEVNVLFCTGFTQHDKTTELLKNGAAEILNKPFRVDELSQQVARHIRKPVK